MGRQNRRWTIGGNTSRAQSGVVVGKAGTVTSAKKRVVVISFQGSTMLYSEYLRWGGIQLLGLPKTELT